jgi:hypothetical protein
VIITRPPTSGIIGPVTTLVPNTIPNIWAWGEPSRLGLNDTDPISTLTDLTGNGRNWTAVTTERPL